jgi:trimethylamine:corrinoid methyltransferase-like protein
MAFGTPEWNQLELLNKEVMEFLGLPTRRKDNLTSACMPDAQAQADKMAGMAFGITHGFTRFNTFPLCADEGWSDVQLVLDVEIAHHAWRNLKQVKDVERADTAFETTKDAIETGITFGEMEDTVLHLRNQYYASPLRRYCSSNRWNNAGRPDYIPEIELYAEELIAKADYAPPEDRFREIMNIYYEASRAFGAEPLELN